MACFVLLLKWLRGHTQLDNKQLCGILHLKPKAWLITIVHLHFIELGDEAFGSWVRAANTIESDAQLTDAFSGQSFDPSL
jgi:hypothetical protein